MGEDIPETRGRCYAIAYGIVLAVQLSMAKELIKSLNAIQITFVRCLVHFLCILFYGAWNDTRNYNVHDTVLYFLCAFTASLSWASTSATFYFIGVGDSTAVEVGATVVFTAVMGHFYLSENIDKLDCVILMADLIGIVFISKPEFLFGSKSVYSRTDQIYGVSMAILSALWMSLFPMFVKKLVHRGTLDIMLLNIFHGIGGIPLCSILSFFIGEWTVFFTIDVWVLLVVFAMTCVLQTLVHASALQSQNAKNVAISSTISTALAYIVQLTIFHAVPDPVPIVGAAIITMAVVIMHLRQFQMAVTD